MSALDHSQAAPCHWVWSVCLHGSSQCTLAFSKPRWIEGSKHNDLSTYLPTIPLSLTPITNPSPYTVHLPHCTPPRPYLGIPTPPLSHTPEFPFPKPHVPSPILQPQTPASDPSSSQVPNFNVCQTKPNPILIPTYLTPATIPPFQKTAIANIHTHTHTRPKKLYQ